MGEEKKKTPRHVKWDYYDMGLDAVISGEEANEIIEEIIELLVSKKITVKVATWILQDTISSIEQEALLERRVIDKRIT